ncbi:MAG: hypothetical protein NDI77_09000 [Geobacteraceae bacterium]|nr:hypothetical protein [Geobacteraceae bacterium]
MRSRSLRERRELEKIILAALFFAVAGDQRIAVVINGHQLPFGCIVAEILM